VFLVHFLFDNGPKPHFQHQHCGMQLTSKLLMGNLWGMLCYEKTGCCAIWTWGFIQAACFEELLHCCAHWCHFEGFNTYCLPKNIVHPYVFQIPILWLSYVLSPICRMWSFTFFDYWGSLYSFFLLLLFFGLSWCFSCKTDIL